MARTRTSSLCATPSSIRPSSINHAHGWMTKHSHLLTAATSRHVSCDVWHVRATDVRSTDRRRTCWSYLAKDVSGCTDGPPDSSASATEELLARAPPALHQRPVLVGSRRSDPNVACPIRGTAVTVDDTPFVAHPPDGPAFAPSLVPRDGLSTYRCGAHRPGVAGLARRHR